MVWVWVRMSLDVWLGAWWLLKRVLQSDQRRSARSEQVCHGRVLFSEFFWNFLEFFRIHVWRVPYEACIPLKYGDPIHRLNQQIKQSIPGTKLFAVSRPQPNLRKRWHRALVKTLNDLGNVQPAADSLSMDARLLLNCRTAAENGNCSQSKRRRVA